MSDSIDKYTYRVTWSEEDQEFVGLCAEFPSLSWLEPASVEALVGVQRLVSEVVQEMYRDGEVPPEPISTRNYSGRFQARINPHVHRKLALRAAEEGRSLNSLVSSLLASA